MGYCKVSCFPRALLLLTEVYTEDVFLQCFGSFPAVTPALSALPSLFPFRLPETEGEDCSLVGGCLGGHPAKSLLYFLLPCAMTPRVSACHWRYNCPVVPLLNNCTWLCRHHLCFLPGELPTESYLSGRWMGL